MKLFLGALTLLALLSCKPQNAANTTKGIEDLYDGKGGQIDLGRQCGYGRETTQPVALDWLDKLEGYLGSGGISRPQDDNQTYRTLLATLAAAPDKMVVSLFEGTGLKVQWMNTDGSNPNSVQVKCEQILGQWAQKNGIPEEQVANLRSAIPELLSCHGEEKFNGKVHPVIYLGAQSDYIANRLLPTLAMFWLEYIVDDKTRLVAAQDQGGYLASVLHDVNHYRGRLSAAFVEDLQAGSKGDVIQKYQGIFGELRSSVPFSNHVFAESFDSYYCSPATRDMFRDSGEFYHSYPIFNESEVAFGSQWWTRF